MNNVDELSAEVFLAENFNAAEYVNNFLNKVKPGNEAKHLQTLRHSLNARNNAASETIKDIVFEHYKHFIEASKEISSLEREVYQLSSSLNEQKNLIENLMEMSGQEKRSSCSTSMYSASSSSQQSQLQALMHKIDGIAMVLNNLKENERVLLQNQMVLLDPNSIEPRHPVYMILLSNNLLICHPSSSGSKYPFQLVQNHSLDNLAIVNVKDLTARAATLSGSANDPNHADHVLQLLIFPDQMYVRCENSRVKRDWLDGIEETKRRQQEENALVRQATIRAKRRNILSSFVTQAGKRGSVSSRKGHAAESGTIKEDEGPKPTFEDTQWLNDLISELQDVISHRHMEQAVEMLLEWKSCACQDAAINAKFAALERTVIQMLTDEVKRPGALHGGARGLSLPMLKLVELDKTTYAIDLYLKRRSALLRTAARELPISEEPLSYVRQVSSLFIADIVEVCRELSSQRSHYSLILQWASRELSILLSLIRRHVIEVVPTMAVLAHTWRILLQKCSQLIPVGIDLTFEVHRLAAPSLRNALEVNFANILNSTRVRLSEERWKPFNLENEQNLNRFLEEMSDLGLSLDWAISATVSPPRWHLNVAQSACQFSRIALSLSRDLAVLNSSHLQSLTDSFVELIWTEYLDDLAKNASSGASADRTNVHTNTCRFIVTQVLPLCEQTYQTDGLLTGLITSKFLNLAQYGSTGDGTERGEYAEDEEEVANV